MSKHVAQSLFFQYSFYREPFWYLEALISRQILVNTFNADLMCDWFYQLCTEILIFVMIFFVSLIYQNNVNLFSILHLFCTNIMLGELDVTTAACPISTHLLWNSAGTMFCRPLLLLVVPEHQFWWFRYIFILLELFKKCTQKRFRSNPI